MTSDKTPVTPELMQMIFDTINHTKALGIKIDSIKDAQLTAILPYSDKIVGNPVTGVIHGGAITTLLDTICGISVPLALGEFRLSPTLDLRIDYMCAAKPNRDVYGRAEVYRITKNVVFSKGIAFQDDDTQPIAHCVATFMLLPKDVIDITQAQQFIEQAND
jgi:uncharacterized protein (TIGR00369 family)